MSEYGFYAEGDVTGSEPVDGPDTFVDDTVLRVDDHDTGFDAGLTDADEPPAAADGTDVGEPDPFGPVDAEGDDLFAGLLDGLDLALADLDLVTDLAFDASYDLIGSDPDEGGWWNVLTSDENHHGAYDEVSPAIDANPYVTH